MLNSRRTPSRSDESVAAAKAQRRRFCVAEPCRVNVGRGALRPCITMAVSVIHSQHYMRTRPLLRPTFGRTRGFSVNRS